MTTLPAITLAALHPGVALGASLGPEDASSVSLFTVGAAIVFTVAIVLVFALEVAASRRASRTLPGPVPGARREPFVVQNGDERMRILERA